MAVEREIKLAIAPDAVGALCAHPLLALLAEAPPTQRWLRSRYYDFDDGRLAAAGIALRLRDDGGGCWFTLKTASSGFGHARGEWEWRSSGDTPTLADLRRALRETPLQALGLDVQALHAGLLARFGTAFERRAWQLRWQGSAIELALDRGSCQAWVGGGLREAPLCEVELELLDGDFDACWELAWALAQDIALPPGPLNKAQRAAALAAGVRPQPALDAQAVASEATLADAMRPWLGSAAAALALWAERVRGAETSDAVHDVHQLRVVLRRLRSVLRWLRGHAPQRTLDWFDAELRWTMQVAAPLRDGDVALQWLHELGAPSALLQRAQQQRGAWRAALIAHLGGARFARLLLALARWAERGAFDGSARGVARRVLQRETRAWRRAQRDARRVLGRGDFAPAANAVRALHALRIRCKRLRLACERFGALGPQPRAHAALGRRCEQLQDLLGAWHDTQRLHDALGDDAQSDALRRALRARGADALRKTAALLRA